MTPNQIETQLKVHFPFPTALAYECTEPENESELSRQLLKKAATSIQCENLNMDQLHFPHDQLSLSHSKGHCWAIVAPEANGVGIDVQIKKEPNPKISKFYLNPSEITDFQSMLKKSHGLIELWTIKEALFKSDLHNAQRGYKDYLIQSLQTPSQPGKATCQVDQSNYHFQTFEMESFFLTVSFRVLP